MNIFKTEPTINWMGHIRLLVGISLVATLAGLILPFIKGINFGIDFAGGYEIEAKFAEDKPEATIQEWLKPLNVGDVRVQRYGTSDEHSYLILLRKQSSLTDQAKLALKADIEKLAGGADGLEDWSIAESGERLTARFAKSVDESELRRLIEAKGLKIKNVATGERTDHPEFTVQLSSIADDIESALQKGLNLPEVKTVVQRVEFVGPQVGAELQRQALFAVMWALLFIMLYVAVRFDLYFAPGAVVALFHDLSITIGVFSLFDLEFNMQALAALLTIVGYSINDTIVVYDRIRENAGRMRGRELRAMVTASINQTMSRTLLTSGVTGLSVASLMLLGGGVVRELSVALFVGIIAGTYSSISIAAPLYIILNERYGKAKKPSSEAPSAAAGGLAASGE